MSDPETPAPIDISPEEEAEMRAKLAAIDRQRRQQEYAAAAEAAAARTAKLAPLRAIVDREAYAEIQADLAALLPAFIGEEPLFPQIKALVDIMPELKAWAAK